MSQIFDYAQYPTPEDFDKIYDRKEQSFNDMKLEVSRIKYNISSIREDGKIADYNYWLVEYNNRVFDLINTYAMLMFYYNKGIPDKDWYEFPDEGPSVVYLPHFQEQHHSYLYWFHFYSESFYTRFFGIIDVIYHLINIKYNLNVSAGSRFRLKVLKALSRVDKDFEEELQAIPKNEVYMASEEFRNNMTHNYRPNQINSPLSLKRVADEHNPLIYDREGKPKRVNATAKVYELTPGNYTTTDEFVKNIEESIDFLGNLIKGMKSKLN